jgi:hypothetical protein
VREARAKAAGQPLGWPGRSLPTPVAAVLALWEDVRAASERQRLLSISPVDAEGLDDQRALLRSTRSALGSLAVVLGAPAETPFNQVVLRTADIGPIRPYPPEKRRPWWNLDGWARAARGNPPVGHLIPAVRTLLATAADLEDATLRSASETLDIDGYAPDSLPERPYGGLAASLDQALGRAEEIQKRIEARGNTLLLRDSIETLQRQVAAGFDYDLVAVEHLYRAGLAEVRAAESEMESARQISLAAEVELLASDLLVRAAQLKQQKAALKVLIARQRAEQKKIDDQIGEWRNKKAVDEDAKAVGKQEIAQLEKKKAGIEVEIHSRAVVVLVNEIALVEAALINETEAKDPKTGEVIKDASGAPMKFEGQLGAIAHLAQREVENYRAALKKQGDDLKEKLQKVREGNCIRGITKVVGSLVCLIPGAGPFIGMGIIAAGEIVGGIHEGQSFGTIAVGLLDNALTISSKAGLDVESELNALGDKLGGELGNLLGDVEKGLGPILEDLPNFLDEQVLADVLDAAGLKGPLKSVFSELRGALVDLKGLPKDFNKLGTVLTAAARAAAVRGASPEELLANLTEKLKDTIKVKALDGRFDAMRSIAGEFGVRFDELRQGDEAAVRAFATKLGGLVLARAAPRMRQERDRVMSTMAIALANLQHELQEKSATFTKLSDFLEREFLAEAELSDDEKAQIKQYLLDFAKLLPPGAQTLIIKDGRYVPISWESLRPAIEAEMKQLLPKDPAAATLFAGRLRMTLDPRFAGDQLQGLVQPWQTALQQRLARVQEILDRPVQGGDQGAVISSQLRNIEEAIPKLDTDVLGWINLKDSPEKQALRTKLASLKNQLVDETGRLRQSQLADEQAAIRSQIAEIDVEIARQRREIAGLEKQKSEIDFEIAGDEILIQQTEETLVDLRGERAKLEKQKRAIELAGARNRFKAAEAKLAAVRERSLALEAQWNYAIAYRSSAPPAGFAVADRTLAELRTERRHAVESVCALCREVLRLMRASGSDVDLEVPGGMVDDWSVADLRKTVESLGREWNERHDYEAGWIEDVEVFRDKDPSLMRRLCSPEGLILDIVPSETPADATPAGDGRILLRHKRFRHARIVACILVVGKLRHSGDDVRFNVDSLNNWTLKFTWLGSTYRWETEQVQGTTVESYPRSRVPNRTSIRPVSVLPWGAPEFLAYNGNFATRATHFNELLIQFNSNDEVLGRLGMHGLPQWGGYRDHLGPPLYGRFYLMLKPSADESVLPEYVRACILYVFDAR